MGFLKQKEYKVYAYTDRKSKKIAPYTSFLEREEFAKLFLKEGADIFMSLKGNANGIRSFEKQAEFNKIKRDFLSYVISVPDKFFKEGNEGFNCIERTMLEQYYDKFTGFKREDKQEDYFF